MMTGCVVGLDDVWQASAMAHSVGHYGQISMVSELAESGDWEPWLVPPLPRLPRNASHAVRRAVLEMAATVNTAAAAAHARRAAAAAAGTAQRETRDRPPPHLTPSPQRETRDRPHHHPHASSPDHRGMAAKGKGSGGGGEGGGGAGSSEGGSSSSAVLPDGDGRGAGPASGLLLEVTHRELFHENVKQAIMLKARSRFAQPGESDGDALRVTLVARGGKELESMWITLPQAPSPVPYSGPGGHGAGAGRLGARAAVAADELPETEPTNNDAERDESRLAPPVR